MISTDDALRAVTDTLNVTGVEYVPLRLAKGRVLAEDVRAKRNQPPFDASAMDGYGIKNGDAVAGTSLTVIGEAAAGSAFETTVEQGQAVRIFTGAPVPNGVDLVIVQENTKRDGNIVKLLEQGGKNANIRPQGVDFKVGDAIASPRLLSSADITLLASMNVPEVAVRKKPVVALIATGDELVMPGEDPRPDQIIASNIFGLAGLLEDHGAEVRQLPIVRDRADSLKVAFSLCEQVDLIVTIGGASVGDHDIVRTSADELGLKASFHKVAMRPGKPLMAGLLNDLPMIGLPGNPVASMVCGHIFLRPAVNAMLGLSTARLGRELAISADELPKNGAREHYMNARLSISDGQLSVKPLARQGNALQSGFAQANCLIVRTPNVPATKAGDMVDIIQL